MKNNDVRIITASPEAVEINKNELAQRLKTNRGFENDTLEMCKKRLLKIINYKCAYIRAPLDLSVENVCNLGFMSVKSKNLYKNLSGCKEVFVLAWTTGIAVDRLLARLNVTSQAEHFMTDALSSAAVESFCDYVCDRLKSENNCVPRFSPGFGDVSIQVQRPLLERLNAAENLGITLNTAYLMTPVKSVTAFMGIK